MAAHRSDRQEGVVQEHTGACVEPFPSSVLEGIEERDRLHEIGAEPGEHEVAFGQRLTYEPEFELLEVAQAAVDELAGPAAGAGRPVARLEQGNRQPARRGVEGAPGADDASSHHHDVERLLLEAFESGGPVIRAKAHLLHGVLFLCESGLFVLAGPVTRVTDGLGPALVESMPGCVRPCCGS